MQETQQVDVILSEPQEKVLTVRASVILNMSGQGGGKSRVIGYSSGMMVSHFPELLGFIGANTYNQLSTSTLKRVFDTWKDVYGYEEYHPKRCPYGAFVVDKQPPAHFPRFHTLRSYDGTISFFNGAMIYLGSLDNYKAHDGKEFAWGHLDETKDTEEAALKEVILGRLRQYGLWYDKETGDVMYDAHIGAEEAHARGWVAWNPLYIHTSPADGGVDWLNDMFQLPAYAQQIKTEVLKKEKGYYFRESGNKAVVIYSTYHNLDNLPPNYIENLIANLNDEDKVLKLVFGYPFGKSGGEWYTTFRRDVHEVPCPFKPGLAIHQSWDFNATPYVTLICAQIEYVTKYLDAAKNKHMVPVADGTAIEVIVIRIYKEYCLPPPEDSIDATCEAFTREHDPAVDEVYYYGDGSGLSRYEGMGGLTPFKLVEDGLWNFFHSDSKKVKFPNVNPGLRRSLINKIFAGQIPEVELYIDNEKCPNLIGDLENTKKGPGDKKLKLKVLDPATKKHYEKYGHTGDALEYLVSEVCKEYIKKQ